METAKENVVEVVSPESSEIVAVVDRFPEDIRRRMRDSMVRLAEVYRASVLETPLVRVRESRHQHENVIELRHFR